MKKVMAITKNSFRLLHVAQELTANANGNELMALLYGLPGEGKTTCIDWAIDKTNGIALRAKSCWTQTGMLADLATELRCPEKIRRSNRTNVMLNSVIEHLNDNPRPLFIDEVDRLVMAYNRINGEKIMECLRDIHDIARIPLVLVGEENSAVTVQENGRFGRRIKHWVEFKGIDREDCRTVADTVCEVAIADDLLDHLYSEAGANIGRIILGIESIERHGKTRDLTEVDLAAWGGKPLFFDQPAFARKRARQ
jgi:hypothetical protein